MTLINSKILSCAHTYLAANNIVSLKALVASVTTSDCSLDTKHALVKKIFIKDNSEIVKACFDAPFLSEWCQDNTVLSS